MYFDDWLVKRRSRAQVQRSLDLVHPTCRDLGLLINEQKSTLTPLQQIEFIGAILDSTQAKAFLPKSCFQAISSLIFHMRDPPSHDCPHVPQAVGPYGSLYLCGPACATPFQTPVGVAGVGLPSQQTLSSPGGHGTGIHPVAPGMMDGPQFGIGRSSLQWFWSPMLQTWVGELNFADMVAGRRKIAL